jgi:hypothetical protein
MDARDRASRALKLQQGLITKESAMKFYLETLIYFVQVQNRDHDARWIINVCYYRPRPRYMIPPRSPLPQREVSISSIHKRSQLGSIRLPGSASLSAETRSMGYMV